MNKYMDQCAGMRGFTLIELMIVVVIAGIILAIAVPSYQNSILESRRNDAQSELMRLKLVQENFRLQNPSFATAAQLALPASDFYDFSVANVSATTFTLTATAKGGQTDDTGCTVINLDQSLNRTPADCW